MLLLQFFAVRNAPVPNSVRLFNKGLRTGIWADLVLIFHVAAEAKNSSGLATFNSVKEALVAIMLCNFSTINVTDKQVFTIRLSFSNVPK